MNIMTLTIIAIPENPIRNPTIFVPTFIFFVNIDPNVINEEIVGNTIKIRITNHGFFQITHYDSNDYQPTPIEIMELFMKTMQFYARIGKIAPKPKLR